MDKGVTTISSIGEVMMRPYQDVNSWTDEEKSFYDTECINLLNGIVSYPYKPNAKFLNESS